MNNVIFDEIEHWLEFIKLWEFENNEPVPDKALCALEYALEKAMTKYRNQETFISLELNQYNGSH